MSKKFVPKKKGDERVNYSRQKLSNVAISYLDEKYPEAQVVLAPQSLDHELDQLVSGSILIRGKIDKTHGYFKPSKQQNFSGTNNQVLQGSERLLKKECILGYVDPVTQTFVWKQDDKHPAGKEEFLAEIICRKVLLAHIDPKFPHIGYIMVEDLLDKEIQTKLSSHRAMLGHIDPATKKFIPDVSSIKDDTIILKRLIKLRAILGYIDPLTLKFVKEQPPLG